MDERFFHRSILAKVLADQTLDESLGVSGGMFLAAPRRTGKSTFVRQDLVPELISRGAEVIYVDLWVDKTKDPAIHIANAVRTELAKDDGPVAKFAKGLGLNKLSVGAMGNGLSFDLSQLGLVKDATLADALEQLSKVSKKKLVVVIDEAQHALTSEQGMAALFSLKAARDSLNTDAGLFGMHLVATGSNRDKLATLVTSREQAFYGADLVDFPTLGRDYVEWMIKKSGIDLDLDRATKAFMSIGSRPEPFIKALRSTQRKKALAADLDASETLEAEVHAGALAARTDFLNGIANLPPLQAVLLREMAAESRLAPDRPRLQIFSGSMRARLQERLKEEVAEGGDVSVDASAIQNALDSLREKSFLWKSQRGAYWIEDEQIAEWLRVDTPVDLAAGTTGHPHLANRPLIGDIRNS